jgi:hypothetical protein
MFYLKRVAQDVIEQIKVYQLNRRIEKLNKEYESEIVYPYNSAKLWEIISELGRLSNAKIEYEEDDSSEANHRKSLSEILTLINEVTCGISQDIYEAGKESDREEAFIMGLVMMKDILDEWDPSL